MSEFTCFCGGMMIRGRCNACGCTTAYLMDGMTVREIEAEERREESEEEEEEK